jgi:hypothetical protein
MTESQREYPMGRYPCLVESCTGRIEEKTGTPLMSFVDRKHGNSGLDKLRSALSGGDRILLKDYIQEFLHGDEEYLWSPMNIIRNEYYDSREDVLALRLAELCYHSLTELDEKTVYRYCRMILIAMLNISRMPYCPSLWGRTWHMFTKVKFPNRIFHMTRRH